MVFHGKKAANYICSQLLYDLLKANCYITQNCNFAVIIEATAYRQHPCLSMNALLVLRPAKLWEFNIGHPCPSLAKGELLLLSQAQPTIGGSFAPNLSAFINTSADNPSVTVTKNSVLQQSIVNLIYKATLKMLYRTVPAPFTQGS